MSSIEREYAIDHLEVILKVAERCNINCDYCYVFNRGNENWKIEPPIIRLDTVQVLADFLRRGALEHGVRRIQVDFHGGEPLLLKRPFFEEICTLLRRTIEDVAEIRFALQTNAILVNQEWIEIFQRQRVHVSVSLDGPRDLNDLHRIDHKGRGTYGATVKGLKLLQRAYERGLLPMSPGVLCVVNPEFNGADVYRHFVDDLGIKGMDFLLPDNNFDECTSKNVLGVTRYLIDAFKQWSSDDNPEIDVRIFSTQLKTLLGSDAVFIGFSAQVRRAVAFTVESSGNIFVDDTLRSINDPVFNKIGNIVDTSLVEVLSSAPFMMLQSVSSTLPNVCEECVWRTVCSGGRPTNRFSAQNKFDNPSGYCSSLRALYSECVGYLARSGVELSKIEAVLNSN